MFVTPEALGDRWDGGKLHGTLFVDLNGAPLGRADAGVDMTFDFGQLIAHAAKTRNLGAGTIIGSGTVSNRDAGGGPGRPIGEGGLGYCCLAEVRTVETILQGEPELRSCLQRDDACKERPGLLLAAKTVLSQSWSVTRGVSKAAPPKRPKKGDKAEKAEADAPTSGVKVSPRA